jgi:cytochrome c biogenesis protein CcmG/thiol:disulfide interchange protein DsbE
MPYSLFRKSKFRKLMFRKSLSLLRFTIVLSVLAFSSPLFADSAPAFELPTNTNPISLSSLKGKVVYLDFWASWCSPCRKSFPWMEKIQNRYKDLGLAVVAVNLDKNKEKAEEFLKQFHSSFTIAFDPEGKTAERYKVMGMPSTYLIDRNGQLQMSHIGFRESDTDALETKIRDLLKQ